jgi:integrase
VSDSINKPDYSYPVSRLKMMRGKQVVVVSVPARLRHLYGGGLRSIRRTTGTSDPRVAQAKHHDIAQKIYDEFDAKQNEHLTKHHAVADNFAADAIYGLATSFNYKNIPDLKPSTEYSQLFGLKNSCDVYADMIMNGATTDEPKVMAAILATSLSAEELVVKFRETQAGSAFTIKQKGLAGRYRSLIVHTYWEDLLLLAARQQELPEPSTEPFKGADIPLAVIDGAVQVDSPLMRLMTNQPVEQISRPARVVPAGVRTLSTVMDEYLVDMRLKLNVLNTQKKLTRWNKQFLDVMGDLEIAEIRSQHAYAYIREVLADNPDRSNRTLKDYCWGVQNLLQYCVRSGYIETNPFRDLDLKKYGKEAEETYPYTSEEIASIFNHNWNEQDRLLLSIVATTGMRPSEVGNMTWERFNDTEYAGIRYITTTDVEGEKVRVKNKGSKRDVPLHPDLLLPERGAGRLFDYTKDEDGRCSTDIGHKLNPTLNRLVPHPNKSIRSFRRTFKVMMRDLGIGEEVHDAITGHSQTTSSGRKNYGGMGLKVKFEAISKLDVSFVNLLQ